MKSKLKILVGWFRNLKNSEKIQLVGIILSSLLAIVAIIVTISLSGGVEEYEYKITVLDSYSENPVNGATITIKNSKGEVISQDLTNDFGVSVFSTEKSQRINLEVSHKKYQKKSVRIENLSHSQESIVLIEKLPFIIKGP